MIKSSGMQFLFSILLAVIQLIMLRLLHEYMKPFELGLYSLAMMLIFLLQSFCDMGISSFSINNNNDTFNFNNKLHFLSLYIGICSLFLGGVGTFFLAYFYQAEVFVLYGIILSLSFPFLTLTGFYQSILIRKKKLITITLYDFISRSTSLLALYLMLDWNWGFKAFIYSYLLYAILRWVLYLIKSNSIINFLRLNHTKENGTSDEVLSYGKFFSFMIYQFLSQFVNSVSVKVDEMVLGRMLGLEVLGVYTLLKNYVVQIGYLILPLIRRISLSSLVGKSDPSQEYAKLSTLFSYLTVSYFLGAVILSKFGLLLVFGDKTESYNLVFIILLMTWAVRISGGSVLSSFFVIKGKPEYDFIWNLLQSGIVASVAIFAKYNDLKELSLYIFLAYSIFVLLAMPIFTHLIEADWRKAIYICIGTILVCSIGVIFSDYVLLLTLNESMILAAIYSALWLVLTSWVMIKKITR